MAKVRKDEYTGSTIVSRILGRFIPNQGCWEWDGNTEPTGYGIFTFKNKKLLAHRASYEMFVGKIPVGFTIDHLCRNRRCVNPDHLEAVTLTENVMRGAGLMAVNSRKTHCNKGHEFTEENTYHPPKNPASRNCKECRDSASRQHALTKLKGNLR